MAENQSSTINENTRRLRAAVRTFMSPAVWLLAAYQAALLMLMRIDLSGFGKTVETLYGPLVFTVLFMGLFFLAAGTYQSFASSRSLVQIPTVIANGRKIFSHFILLSIKVGLLGLVVINVLVLVAQGFSGLAPEEILRIYARYLTLIVAGLALVFVYWLPLVFVRGNFRLFETLSAALTIGRKRLPQVGFLAALILLPPAILAILPGGTHAMISMVISVAGELMAWVAYVYCVDYLQTGGKQAETPRE
jgi:hypothetical protein